MKRILSLIELTFIFTLFWCGGSLIKLLLASREVEKITLNDLIRDFDFDPKERFLVYGFSDFFNQIKALEYNLGDSKSTRSSNYYILSVNPYPTILVEFSNEEEIISRLPNDLNIKKYYNFQRVV